MHTRVLDNGLRIVVQPRPFPLASLTWWVDAGSADERSDEHGAAHFLEHMLFKGTARRGVGEAPAAIEDLGGDLNAYTSLEQTVLYATVEASGWREGLDVIADMARYSLLDPSETERERAVVLEEIRGALSDPEEALYRTMQQAAFPDHAYARPILGTAEEVAALPRDVLHRFWRREWTPGRTVISVAGDVDAEAVFAEVERLCGDWAPGSARRELPKPARTGRGPRIFRVDGGTRQTRQVELLWPTVPETHADHPALEILALALGDGPGGAVPDRLTDADVLLADPSADATGHLAGGSLSLSFVPDRDQAPDQLRKVVRALHEVLGEGLDEELVERVKAGVQADHLFEAETAEGAAWAAAHDWAVFGAPDFGSERQRRTGRVTSARLREVAARYLTPDRLSVGLLLPEHAPAEVDRLGPDVRARLGRPGPPVRSRLETTLDNGVRLRVEPDDGDVIGLSIQLRGGRLTEPPRRAGLATAWAQLVTAGADGLSAGAFSAAVDRTGGELWGASGRSTLALNGRFPAPSGLEGLRLALAAIADPELDPTAWGRVREEMLHDAESAPDFASWVAAVALWGRIWARHPWARPGVGTPGSVRALSPDVIRDYHDEHVTGDNLVVAVTGPVSTPRVARLVDTWLSDLPARSALRVPAIPPQPTRSSTLHRHAPGEQAHVEVGARGLAVDDPDVPAAQVLITILGAQGGRFFLDLRERRHLAYDVWADGVQATGGGLMQAGLACDPARLDDAVDALHAALDDAVARPPSSAELERAVRTLRGGRLHALQRASWRARRLASAVLLDLETDPLARVARWARVTPDHVSAVAARLLGSARTTVIVHPEP